MSPTLEAGDDIVPAHIVYLGISGVLHPSQTTYKLVRGRSPWDDGHVQYEGVPILATALEPYPAVRIVLTSTQPWAHGLASVLEQLGALAARVDGLTYEDLTQRAKRVVCTRSGTTRTIGYSNEDYWRMNKSHIVAAHVEWLRPSVWVVIDDDGILWPDDATQDRLVLTDGCTGLMSAAMQDRLLTVLLGNFGQEVEKGCSRQAPPLPVDKLPTP